MVFAIVNVLKIFILIMVISLLISFFIDLFKEDNLKKSDNKHSRVYDIEETRSILWKQYIKLFHVEHYK